jgi:hypothetical protein
MGRLHLKVQRIIHPRVRRKPVPIDHLAKPTPRNASMVTFGAFRGAAAPCLPLNMQSLALTSDAPPQPNES